MAKDVVSFDLQLELDNYVKNLKLAEEKSIKSFNKINDLKAAADRDNIIVAEKLNKKKNADELKLAKELAKKKADYLKYLHTTAQRLVTKRIKEEKKAWKDAHAEERKRVKDASAEKTKRIQEAINKEVAAQKKKLAFIHAMQMRTFKRELADTAKQEKAKTALINKEAAKRKSDYDKTFMGSVTGGTSFGHKVATTAQYATAGAGLYAMANALREVATASIAYDNALFNTMAVLKATRTESEALLASNRDIAVEYGLVISEIDNASIVLGRAGVAMSNLAEATRVTAQLSKITGDSMEDSSKVVSSFTMAFGLASSQVGKLGNQLAYAANASKLSIEDLGTMANYALSGAKALGLTKEEVLALSTAFSNVGVNASTIGTQIRKFGKLVRDDSKSSIKFFADMGIAQEDLMEKLKSDDPEAFTDFVAQVTDMNEATYNSSVQGMEILTKQFLDTLRVTGGNVLKHYKKIKGGGDDLVAQSRIQALSIEGLWNSAVASIGNAASGIATDIADSFTNRDKLIAYVEALKHLEKGSTEYLKIKAQIIKLSGGKHEFENEDRTKYEQYGDIQRAINKTNSELRVAQAEFDKAVALNSANVTGTLGVKADALTALKTRLEELNNQIIKINSDSKLGEANTLINFDEAKLLKMAQLVNKINGVEASALQVKKDSLELLDVQIKKAEELDTNSEIAAAYEEIALETLEIELQYQKDLAAEKKKAETLRKKELSDLKKTRDYYEKLSKYNDKIYGVDQTAQETYDSRIKTLIEERELLESKEELRENDLEMLKASLQYEKDINKEQAKADKKAQTDLQARADAQWDLDYDEWIDGVDSAGLEWLKGFSDDAANSLAEGIQQAFDGDFNFSTFTKNIADSMAQAMIETSLNNAVGSLSSGESIDGSDVGMFGIGLMVSAISSNYERANQEEAKLALAMENLESAIDRLGESLLGVGDKLQNTFTDSADVMGAYNEAVNNRLNFSPTLLQDATEKGYTTDAFSNIAVTLGLQDLMSDLGDSLFGAGNSPTAVLNKVLGFGKKISGTEKAINRLNTQIAEARTGIVNWALEVGNSAESLVDFGNKFEGLYDSLTDTTYFSDLAGENATDKVLGTQSVKDAGFTNLTDLLFTLGTKFDLPDIQKFKEDLAQPFDTEAFKNATIKASEIMDTLGVDVLNMADDIELAAQHQINANNKLAESMEKTAALADRLARAGASDSTISELNFAAELSEYENLSDQKLLLDIYEKEQSARIAEEAAAARLESQRNGLEAQKTALNDYLSSVTEQLSDLESVFKSLGATIAKLRGEANGSTWSLNQFQIAMSQAMSSKNSADIQSAIDKSSALFNDSAFTTQRDKEFAQLVAANKFETLEQYTETEIDYLRQIEINTRAQITTLATSINALGSSIASFQRVDYSAIFEAITGSTAAEAEKVIEETNTGTTTSSLADQMASAIESGRANLASSVHQVWFDYLDTATESQAQSNYTMMKDKYGDDYWGFANGGYTGDTVGIVHPNEYVLNAETSSMLGLNDSSSTGVFGQLVTAQARNNQLLNDIIMELKDSKDISNESLRTLQTIEEAS